MKYTKYELARIIGTRALQLSQGDPLLVKLSEKELAKAAKLKAGKLPAKRKAAPKKVAKRRRRR